MPELAEVEYYRRQWNPGLGQRVRAVILHARKRLFRGTNPRALRSGLSGKRLVASETRGKKMLFRFSSDQWLGIHLGMSGRLRVEPLSFRPAKHDHLVLQMETCSLVLRDARMFGIVRYHAGKGTPEWWPSEVPEISSRQFDQKFFGAFLERHRRAPIKAVLLLQSGFSGIGNWMADEILWRAQVHPATRTADLNARQRATLWRETRYVARQSLKTIGRHFPEPPDDWLIHQRWKSDGVCPIHGIALDRATIGGRTTAWCPRCQGAKG